MSFRNGVRLFVLSRVDRRDGAESRAASCAYGQGRPCVAGQSCARRCDRNARCAGRTSTHQHANVPATAAALLPSSSPCLKYKDGVGNYKALNERVTKRVAINRERAHPALHQNRACCCPLHICSLLLVAAHCWPSDDLSDGLFDRPSDRPSDPASDVLSLMASLMASLMTSLMLSLYSSAGLVSHTSQYVKRERERELGSRAQETAIKRAGGRSSTGLRLLAWLSPSPLVTVAGPTSRCKGNTRARKSETVLLYLIGEEIPKRSVF